MSRWTEVDERRLTEVATRRLARQSWAEIARALGWNSKQAAQRWTRTALERRPWQVTE